MIFPEAILVEDFQPHSAALNMALDEILLRRAKGVLIRFYLWDQPAVSFGYFGTYREVAAAWPERESVRRWTGGGTVPHGADFTYSVIVPAGGPFAGLKPLESYRRLHEAVARAWGPEAALADSCAARISPECFANPVESDVLSQGRKVAGGAQRRTASGLLHQGSVQGAPEGFGEQLLAEMSGRIQRRPPTKEELAAAGDLARERYGAEAWLKRR